MVVAPWILASAAIVCGAIGLRPDLTDIAWPLIWGATLTFLFAGCGLLVLAARATIPGRGPSVGAVSGLLMLVLEAQAGIAAMLHHDHASPVPAGKELSMAVACLGAITVLGLPTVLLGWHLARKALPTRPLLCGSLIAAGATVTSEAIWRRHCPFTDGGHLLVSHLPIYGVLGVAACLLVSRVSGRGRAG